MALNRVDLGIQYFPQFAADRAIANAQIFVGQPNLDPQIVANQIQAYVVQEDGTQVAVPQPVRTGAGGVPTYNGSPVQVAVATNQYSVKILNSLGSQIYYQPNIVKDQQFISAFDFGKTGGNTIANLVGITPPVVTPVYYDAVSYYNGFAATTRGTQGGGLFVWDATEPKSNHDGGVKISPTVPWNGLQGTLLDFVNGVGETDPSGNGCWVRVVSNKPDITWWGGTGDGVVFEDGAVTGMTQYVASVFQSVTGRRQQMPKMYLPSGQWRVATKKVMSNAFTVSHYRGVTFQGDGEEQTTIIYDSVDASADNYLGDFSSCSFVRIEDMTINFTNSVLKGFFWASGTGGDGRGSFWRCKNVRVTGSYAIFFDVGGTVLGSETYWERCSGPVPTGGVFFNVAVTNPQSVNHTFVNCQSGGNGKTFQFRAGGNVRWYGGYVSGSEGYVFLDIDGNGTVIGANNKNFLFDGLNFETTGGVVSAKILTNNSGASIVFRGGNMTPFLTSGPDAIITMGDAAFQRGGDLVFDKVISANKTISINGSVTVKYQGCDLMPDWQTFMTLNRSTTSNFLQPCVEIDGCEPSSANPRNPVDCYPNLLVNSFEADPVAAIQQFNVKPKYWIARNGATNTSNGLLGGLGNIYNSFSCLVPLGAIVRKVRLYYFSNDSGSTAQRQFKVENFDASVTLLAEQTIASPAVGPNTFASGDLFYIADTEAKRELKFFGRINNGVSGQLGDYGYFEIEYM